MIRVTIDVAAPEGLALAVKEDLAMVLERYGDTRVVSVVPIEQEGEQGMRIKDAEKRRAGG